MASHSKQALNNSPRLIAATHALFLLRNFASPWYSSARKIFGLVGHNA
jgi:hypothetical protein